MLVIQGQQGVIEVVSERGPDHPYLTSHKHGYTELGRALIKLQKHDTGIYVPTNQRDLVTIDYAPYTMGTVSNPQVLYDELRDLVERDMHMFTRFAPIPLNRSAIAPVGPGPSHDFGNRWTHTQEIGRKHFWTGYAHNAGALIGWAWFVTIAVRFVRTRPWRDWKR